MTGECIRAISRARAQRQKCLSKASTLSSATAGDRPVNGGLGVTMHCATYGNFCEMGECYCLSFAAETISELGAVAGTEPLIQHKRWLLMKVIAWHRESDLHTSAQSAAELLA